MHNLPRWVFAFATEAPALRLSDSPQRLDRLPAAAEDMDTILRELGYSETEIATFRKDKAI